MMNSFDMSWVSLAMAVLQISVVIWKGGELSQRVTGLEMRMSGVENKIGQMDADIGGLKMEVSYMKGLLTGWKQPPPSELNL
jgi:hypothetical protein